VRVNHEARGKEDRRVLSAQSIPYRPLAGAPYRPMAGEISLLLTKENRAEPIPYRPMAGETPTPMAAENRAERIPYRPMAGAPYRSMTGETPTLVAMRNQLAPPEQSIWSHHLMRGPRRGSPQGLGDQRHHQL
jgi:hypothetical protein